MTAACQVERLEAAAKELGLSLATLTLARVLRRGNVAGATKPSQLEENAEASGVERPKEALVKIEAILAG
jgi:aryl-alcohol dehydrogenase-like predicted oxidoreductase